MLNKVRHCDFCGHYTIAQFCCDRCRERYSLKQRALKAPPITPLQDIHRREKIEDLLSDWDLDHDCPERCNGGPDRKCSVCVGWEGECKEEIFEEYRKALESMSPAELAEEVEHPSW